MVLPNSSSTKLLFKKDHPDARVKPPSLPGDAGINLYCVEDTPLPAHPTITKVELGIRVALPDGLVATMITRSGAVMRGLFCLPGLIDTGYRGPLFAFVVNLSGSEQMVMAGESIVQLFLLLNCTPGLDILDVTEMGELPSSIRGTNGFGHTGR